MLSLKNTQQESFQSFFINGGVAVDEANRVITLSPIFQWYTSDFGADVVDFVLRHMKDGDPKEQLRLVIAGGEFTLRYSDYDWTPNDSALS